MKSVKNIIITFTILSISIFLYIFLNLGIYLDASSKPKKVDLIVCLGGGDHKKRQEKTIELYKDRYLKENTIIFTGIKSLSKDVENNFDKKTNLLIVDKVKNTMEEVLYTKKYIKEHQFSSVLFVTEIPHSRRLKIFWDNFGDNLDNIDFSVVASELKSWDSKSYYKDKLSREYAYSEVIKLIYNFFIYGFLDKFGLKDIFENNFKEELKEKKRELLSAFK